MDLTTTRRLEVDHPSAAVEARRLISLMADLLALSPEVRERAKLVATELVTNLSRHAGRGFLLLGALPEEGLELLALDQGPGIRDLRRTLLDGVSSAGSAGTGLGAIRRLSDLFDIYTQPGRGTAVLSRFAARAGASREGTNNNPLGAVSTPLLGEEACGDRWASHSWRDRRRTLVVIDGLGHGIEAARAASEAVRIFRERPELEPTRLLERIHEGLKERRTRGAAVSIAELHTAGRELRFAGCGNVHGQVLTPGGVSRSLPALPGIVGQRMRTVRESRHSLPPGARLVIASDGLRQPWLLDSYPGLLSRHPALLAAVLYRDHQRGNDDATVVAVATPGEGPR